MEKNIFRLSSIIAFPGVNIVYSAEEKVNFYPNPVAGLSPDTIQYELVNSQKKLFRIYNMDGEEVMVKEINPSQTHIELGNQKLSAGMYFYRLKSEEKEIARGKVIVQ